MKNLFRIVNAVVLFSLLVFSVGYVSTQTVGAQETIPPRVCIPTCSEVDGRMLAVASVGYITLAGQTISVEIAVPGSLSSFSFGFFDGDTGGMWDNGTVPLVYTLYANPDLNHDTTIQVDQWSGTEMVDNAWTDITVDQIPAAKAPGGDYFYFLQIELPDAATVNAVSNFKLRSNSPIELATDASFAYVIPLNTMAEFNIIYPGYQTNPSNPFAVTTYDGVWNMYLSVPTSSPSFSIWDGDTDYGSIDCSLNDTNDADTPDDVLPVWASGISEVLEGVATTASFCVDGSYKNITGPGGQTFTSGNPADDSNSIIYRRSPSVVYKVTDPNGNVYHNDDPSGNQEWEQFLIESDPGVPADYHVNGFLPAGIYHIQMTGLDMHNLNAWHLISGKVVCVYEDGTPCIPILHPYKIGDTIWYDNNGNGIQDNGELGIEGVTVTLLDVNNQPVPGGTAVTDPDGKYSFGVEAGTYTVQVNGSNFDAGGALAGMVSTTGGEIQTNTVATDNVLIYDFGYRGTASIGNLVWIDANGNGIQDGGEAILAGVTVNLIGADGTTILATTTTASDGTYDFLDLRNGTYFVKFILPSGYVFTTRNAPGSTFENDSNVIVTTGLTGAILLAPGQTDNTIDAGLNTCNFCGFIRTPGFWKNYSNHMTSTTFLQLIRSTQDFKYLTVAQAVKILGTNSGITRIGIPALDGTDARFLKFLLTSEINAVWNGNDAAPGLNTFRTAFTKTCTVAGCKLGAGYYADTGLTVNQILHRAYLDRRAFTTAELNYVLYLGASGEGVNQTACLVQSTP